MVPWSYIHLKPSMAHFLCYHFINVPIIKDPRRGIWACICSRCRSQVLVCARWVLHLQAHQSCKVKATQTNDKINGLVNVLALKKFAQNIGTLDEVIKVVSVDAIIFIIGFVGATVEVVLESVISFNISPKDSCLPNTPTQTKGTVNAAVSFVADESIFSKES